LLLNHARPVYLYNVRNTILLSTKKIMKTKGTKQKIQEAKTTKQLTKLEKRASKFQLASPRTMRKIERAIKAKKKELS
jgi:hypothetical protein